MTTILNKLDLDKDQEKFLELTPEERGVLLNEILTFGNNNRNELINYCYNIEPTQFCNLEVIYEALAKDPDNWGDFIFEEFKRIFKQAKQSKNPFTYTSCLDIGIYFENKNKPFVDKIITFLTGELDSSIDDFRHRALWFLSDWIDDEYSYKYKKTIDKMSELINDPNWKIRYITNLVIIERPFASNYHLTLSFWDKVRGKYTLFFSNPFEIEHK